MITQPYDASWLCGQYAQEFYCFIYIRATPEQVVARLGGRLEDFEPGPFPDDPDEYPGPGDPSGVTSIGDWTLVFYPDWIGTGEDLLTELSKGTRLVYQAALGIEDLDYFYWCEDGETKYAYGDDDAYGRENPDELAETLAEINRLYPSFPRLYKGPAFLLAEHLTGIRLTEQLLKDASFRWGVVPKRPSS